MNVYDLLGSHGQEYGLRADQEARKAIDPSIYQSVAGQDRYLSWGTMDIYCPTMEAVVSGVHAHVATWMPLHSTTPTRPHRPCETRPFRSTRTDGQCR